MLLVLIRPECVVCSGDGNRLEYFDQCAVKNLVVFRPTLLLLLVLKSGFKTGVPVEISQFGKKSMIS